MGAEAMMQGRGMHEAADMDALTLRDRLASGAFTATAVATAMLQRLASPSAIRPSGPGPQWTRAW